MDEKNTVTQEVSPNIEDEKQEQLLAGKYKTVEDLTKGYQEVQSSYSKSQQNLSELTKKYENFSEAPEKYDLGKREESDLVNGISEWAKEINLGQNGFNKLMTKYDSIVNDINTKNYEAEMTKLGDNGKERLDKIDMHLKNNFPDLNSEAIVTADQVAIIEALIGANKPSNAPVEIIPTGDIDDMRTKLKNMISDERMNSGDQSFLDEFLNLSKKIAEMEE